jgi:hypothetical protein
VYTKTKSTVALVLERTIPTERPPLVDEASANFADEECRVVSAADPYGRNLGFLDRSRYFFFQAAPQLPCRNTRNVGAMESSRFSFAYKSKLVIDFVLFSLFIFSIRGRNNSSVH